MSLAPSLLSPFASFPSSLSAFPRERRGYMPRIRPRDFLQAKAINPSLSTLLPVCRHLRGAQNELRWLKDHAVHVSKRMGQRNHADLLTTFIRRRAGGEPLQYILGSEFFGNLEIQCRPGVLIPRQETAESVSYLATMVAEKLEPSTDRPLHLRVLDLCTGSGCIPLLFHHEYYERAPKNSTTALELVGVDISGDALSLARENLIHQIAAQSQPPTSNLARTRSLHSIGFVQADVLNHESADCANVDTSDTNQTMSLSQALRRLHTESTPNFDLLISNPPYISPKSFRWTTARSVKMYEPTSALVPPYTSDMSDEDAADRFYPSLLSVAIQVNAKAFLFEVADMEQAVRVALKAHEQGVWEGIEIWRDCPGAGSRVEDLQVGNTTIKVRGVGNGRSVFAYRLDAKDGVIP